MTRSVIALCIVLLAVVIAPAAAQAWTETYTWAPSSGATSYRLETSVDGGSSWMLQGTPPTTSFTLTMTSAGLTLVRVLPCKSSGCATTIPSGFWHNEAWRPGPALLQSTSLVRLGAFRVPQGIVAGSQAGQKTFAYGGTSLAFNAANRSLFVVGHDWDQQVAEIQIPASIVDSATIGGLNVATVLQPFADVTEGRMKSILASPTETVKVGGLFVWNGQLVASVYDYYDGCACNAQSSHFVSGLSLATPGDVRGPFRVGDVNPGFVAGYMMPVPPEWQATLGGSALTGNCCLSIISRTSFGPAAFAFDPANLGVLSPVPAPPLVEYPQTHPTLGNWNSTWDGVTVLFNSTTQIKGAVLVQGTRSVLFFGRQGTGTFCYGQGTSTNPPPAGYCYDPIDAAQGSHAYPYRYQVWAYDLNDLAAVKAGGKLPWDVKPYAVWALPLPYVTDGSAWLGGAAYDSTTGRIYVSQQFVDGLDRYPVIHVFQVTP